MALDGVNQTQPKGDPTALSGTCQDRGIILYDDMREKTQILYNRRKRENEDRLNKQLWVIHIHLVRH